MKEFKIKGFEEISSKKMENINGGLVFTTAGLLIGAKVGAKAVAAYGAKKAVIGTGMKVAGTSGAALDIAGVTYLINR